MITRLRIDDDGRETAMLAIEAQPTTAKGKQPLYCHGEILTLNDDFPSSRNECSTWGLTSICCFIAIAIALNHADCRHALDEGVSLGTVDPVPHPLGPAEGSPPFNSS